MKKLLSMLLVLSIMVSTSVLSFADGVEEMDLTKRSSWASDADYEEHMELLKLTEEYYAEQEAKNAEQDTEVSTSPRLGALIDGSDGRTIREKDDLKLPVDIIYQNQPGLPWKKVKLGSSSKETIGSAGCGISCIAMFTSFVKFSNYTPLEINDMLGSTANRIKWKKLQGNDYGLNLGKFTPVKLGRKFKHNIRKRIFKSQRPVFVKMSYRKDGRENGGKHYVLATGYKWNGNDVTILINDSNYYARYTTLQQYLDKGYKIRGAHTFTLD